MTLYEQEGNYYKPTRVDNFWTNNYIEYRSYGDRNKNLPLKEYLEKIKPYLMDTIIDLQNSDTWNIFLQKEHEYISLKYFKEEHVMHSKRDIIEYPILELAQPA